MQLAVATEEVFQVNQLCERSEGSYLEHCAYRVSMCTGVRCVLVVHIHATSAVRRRSVKQGASVINT